MPATGFPAADAENDFLRVRRKRVLSRLAAWLRREPDDVSEILPFNEVVAALGRTGERRLGLQVVHPALPADAHAPVGRPGGRPLAGRTRSLGAR
jgi:hypothetical protein